MENEMKFELYGVCNSEFTSKDGKIKFNKGDSVYVRPAGLTTMWAKHEFPKKEFALGYYHKFVDALPNTTAIL